VEVLGGVFILGIVAAAYISADLTDAQVYPTIPHLQAFFAALRIGSDVLDQVQVGAAHGFTGASGKQDSQPVGQARLGFFGHVFSFFCIITRLCRGDFDKQFRRLPWANADKNPYAGCAGNADPLQLIRKDAASDSTAGRLKERISRSPNYDRTLAKAPQK
jgi:hypothetical protein